jgi:hypothetical protein
MWCDNYNKRSLVSLSYSFVKGRWDKGKGKVEKEETPVH